LEQVFTSEFLSQLQSKLQFLVDYVLSVETLLELGIILALALIAWGLARAPDKKLVELKARHGQYPLLVKAWSILHTVIFPLIWLVTQWLANLLAERTAWRTGIMFVTASLLTAWVVIRIASTFIRNPLLSSTVAMVAWSVAALNILGWLSEAVLILDSVGMSFGNARLTLLTLIKGIVSLVVLMWASSLISEFFESRIKSSRDITPSVQVLFAKLFKIALFTIAFLVAITAVGIDLTAFAVLGGAIGVGIGFGLQKIVSNLISGVILLLDQSIKPGDVIAIGENYGIVSSLGARYVSVKTRDGIEHLIPNEELIINRVENWTHSDSMLRLRIVIGVHYRSDVKLAMKLIEEAASETDRVLADPPPQCLVRAFSDSAVNLELRFWINDPMNGRARVGSEIQVRVWDKFHEQGIEFPYPQRDLHIRSADLDGLKAEWDKT